MIRAGVLLLLLSTARAYAQPAGFDARLAGHVYATALSFMAPRILEPVPIPVLTGWGLHGLAALDPSLSVETREDGIRLVGDGHMLLALPPPAPDDAAGWGEAAARMAAAAWDASPALRRAGQSGVVRNFFDELFNHLDPYSRYEPPDAAAADRSDEMGDAGLGVTLAARGRAIVLARVLSDGPAEAAGMVAGDIILRVDGAPATGKPDRVASLLAGLDGSPVSVDWRGRDGRAHADTLVRARVPPDTVDASRDGAALVIRISGFNRLVAARFGRALTKGLAARKPPDGVIIDLRGNRGGLVREAVAITSLFLPSGVIATTAGRDPDATHVWRARGAEVAADLPVVIVVDGRTASAAEILSAALSDRGRAVVVGSATLGKGLVQVPDPMPDGGELFVTWSRVLAPRDWPIQGLGVMPQVCTSLGEDNTARELRALQAGRAPMARALARHDAARAPLPPADIVSLRNACPAAEGRRSDIAVARFLVDNPGAYASALLAAMR